MLYNHYLVVLLFFSIEIKECFTLSALYPRQYSFCSVRWRLPGLCHLGNGKENLDFKPEDIKRVVSELHWVFDVKSIDEAEEHYQNSPY